LNRYLKLVHMEVHRFRYMLAGLMAITMISQICALIRTISIAKAKYLEVGHIEGSAFFPSGKLSFAWALFSTQRWFILPILLSIAVVGLYVFLIWYRDWFERNTFAYRLLMLPTARRNIYLAKGTAILIIIFSLVAFQLLLLPVENMIFKLIIPSDMREASYLVDIISANRAFSVLLPHHFDQFVVSYGIGIFGIVTIFTAILLERSYRKLGILYAILYVLACLFVIFYPPFALGHNQSPYLFFPEEIFSMELAISVIEFAVSIWLGFRLLAKKITV
jgi:hypothetical protein